MIVAPYCRLCMQLCLFLVAGLIASDSSIWLPLSSSVVCLCGWACEMGQGSLGDCYLVSAMSVIATQPELVKYVSVTCATNEV